MFKFYSKKGHYRQLDRRHEASDIKFVDDMRDAISSEGDGIVDSEGPLIARVDD